MKTCLTVLGFCLLLISCQAETELQETEALTSANASYTADGNKNTIAAETSEDTSEETEEEATEEVSCETLFARGTDEQSECFSAQGFSRWGWTIGPLSEGDYTFELYAGAGQCDIEKGTLVGHLSVNYADGTAAVNYEMLDGFTLSEAHLYIGNAPYPSDKKGDATVAPGQYPYQKGLEDASACSFEVSGLSGDIYVIAHGVTCSGGKDGDGNTTEETDEPDTNYTPS